MIEKYDIDVKVPLGIRKGSMELEFMDDKISGCMKLFGNMTPFSGYVQNGQIHITGTLQTRIRTISYRGSGAKKEDEIHLQLRRVGLVGREDIYELHGVPQTQLQNEA